MRKKMASPFRHRLVLSAFTLIEVLVSMTILLIIMGVGLSLLGQTTAIWQHARQQVEAFQSARLGFDLMTRDLSQATLNTYIEYLDNQNTAGAPFFESETSYDGVPARYARKSDLHFVIAYPATTFGTSASGPVPGTANTGTAVFFQAPLGFTAPVPSTTTTSATVVSDPYAGLDKLLNAVGYYVSFCQDNTVPAHVVVPAGGIHLGWRYRLKQLVVPADRNIVFPKYYDPYLSNNQGQYKFYDPTNPGRWFTGNTLTPALSNLTRPDGATATTGVYPSNESEVADNVLIISARLQDPSSQDASGNPSVQCTPELSWSSPNTYLYDSHFGERTLVAGVQPVTANQIPPVIQVSMIAIDETSALRMDNGMNQPTALANLLSAQNATTGQIRFTDQTHYDDDVRDVETRLQTLRINYRVFSTSVPIRETKWTK